jgi:Stage II sporulation protein E (SpoIIE)/ACT domain
MTTTAPAVSATALMSAAPASEHSTDHGRLLIRCQDRPGIVSAISTFLTDVGANIVTLLAAVRLASVAATSFRDACGEPGLSLTEVARAVDLSVTRAGGDEDFVTAVFAELDPRGWIQLVNCGHPSPLRLSADGELRQLNPPAFAAPLGLHPDLRLSTFSVRTGDRLVFFTDGLLEARDRAGQFFRLDQQVETLRQPDLQAAADQLLDRLRAHTRHRLDDDVAVLLAELTLTDPPCPARRARGSYLPRRDGRVSTTTGHD